MNRLQDAKSPYLLQHKHNPVDWYPWGEEAFAEARRRDVPVFLSIGYATCHWCHVMERESFEDTAVADLMNRHFVSIKVDREERPDIDDVYMTVCLLIGKQGGWPLNAILTPEKEPFYVATYLPKTARFGRLGMMELIPRVARLWEAERDRVEASAREMVALLERSAATPAAHAPGQAGDLVPDPNSTVGIEQGWLEGAYASLRSRYDATYGGFGSAPKFPSPHNLSFLFRYGAFSETDVSGVMARDTINAMWRGGVFDQIGFGFHRYSTDEEWRLPHFEKMLHDQATMLDACVDGWLLGEGPELREVGLQIAEYVQRDLTHPDGGFYSAEDADSEGEEGKFYVWSLSELGSVLTPDQRAMAEGWFGLSEEGNYLDEATRQRTGTNVLHPGWNAASPNQERLAEIRARLLAARAKRIRPLRDEKVLTDWNGLMIGSLARAGDAFEAPRLVEAAHRAYRFIRRELKTTSGWLHRWFEGDAAVPAMLDDYAFLGYGLLELFQATSDPSVLRDALELAEAMIAHCDAPDGGFYRSSDAGEILLVRKQDWYDGAMPSGVSRAVGLLLNLGALAHRDELTERAAALISASRRVMDSSPAALSAFLADSVRAWNPGPEVVVVADVPDDPLVRTARSLRRSGGFAFWLPVGGERREAIEALIPWTAAMGLVDGRSAAYVCRDYTCQLPVTNEKGLRDALGDTEASIG